jgi:cell division protein FtsB
VRRREHEREVLSKGGFESEKVARETYHMSKPGEKVLRLKPSPLDEDVPTTTGAPRP